MADWYQTSLGVAPNNNVDASPSKNQKPPLLFRSRRSPLICRHAAVASSQPLASAIGYDILKHGANAADAAVAVAAALAVTEPCSTGLGGDMFCLYYDASLKQVFCVNGSGQSPAALTLQRIQEQHPGVTNNGGVNMDAFRDSPLSVTVPGAAAGWEDLLLRHGSGQRTLEELLQPALQLAQEGFPVAPVTSHHWQSGLSQITKWLDDNDDVIPLTTAAQTAPQPGDIVCNPHLARVLKDLGQHGAQKGFYQNPNTGGAIVEVLQKHGGCMTTNDLAKHQSTFPDPISVPYRNVRLWQHPPNGQGIAGLIALAGVECLEQTYDKQPLDFRVGTADWYHCQMEMMRLGFADNRAHVADANHMTVSVEQCLLDRKRIQQRALNLFDKQHAKVSGCPDVSSCTVSFQVVDSEGNAVSFVNSNFMGFGTGIVPKECGFTLQNRGFGFSLQEGHPNCVGPSKRPYHTIIPGMLTHNNDSNDLYATISNMGGNMQPQGHLQLTLNMIAGEMDPQTAIDMPRFCIADGTQGGVVHLEEGVEESVVQELKQRGHAIKANVGGHDRSVFGRAQIIKRDKDTGVLWAGSDGRADGCAMGF